MRITLHFQVVSFLLLFSLTDLLAGSDPRIDSTKNIFYSTNVDSEKVKSARFIASHFCKLSQYDSGLTWYLTGFRISQRNENALTDGRSSSTNWTKINISLYDGLIFFYCRQMANHGIPDSIYRAISTRWNNIGAFSALAELKEEYATYTMNERSEIDKGIRILREALAFWEASGDKLHQARIYEKLGRAFQKKNEYPAALDNIFKGLLLANEIKDDKLTGTAYQQLGNVYKSIGNFKTALEYYLKALPIRERGTDKTAVTGMLINIGIAYMELKMPEKALSYHEKALKLCIEMGDWSHQSMELNNIAIIYLDWKKYDTAVAQLRRAVNIRILHNDKDGIAWYENAVGDAFLQWERPDSAIFYYNESIKIIEGISNPDYTFRSYAGLSSAYQFKKNYSASLEYAWNSMSIAVRTGSLEQLMESEQLLSSIYRDLGDFRKAYDHYTAFIRVRDSISNDDKSKEIGRLEAKSDFDKQQGIAEAEHKKELEKQQALADAEAKRKNLILGSVISGLVVVITFAIFIFNRFRVTKKQKEIIEVQKKEVEGQKTIIEDKNKEIIDSINYAKRIQDSLLPTEKYIERSLNKFF